MKIEEARELLNSLMAQAARLLELEIQLNRIKIRLSKMQGKQITLIRIANGWICGIDSLLYYEHLEDAMDRVSKLAVYLEGLPEKKDVDEEEESKEPPK